MDTRNLRPLHDYVLVRPLKKDGRTITSDLTPMVMEGTVVAVGPFVGGPMLWELQDGIAQMEVATTQQEEVQIETGDTVHFPYQAAFKLGSHKDPVYAIRSHDLIAVEKLTDSLQ